MNKGIFQSGSVGTCEKHSDVFHHIRYSNSPRAVVPHKSIEIPKPLLTLEDYKEAEKKLEKRLQGEGYGGSHRVVQKVAKGLKTLWFLLVFIPFYIVVQLPLTLLSLGLSFLRYVLERLGRPVLHFFDRCAAKVREWGANVDWESFAAKFSFWTGKKDKKSKEKEFIVEKVRVLDRLRFWKNWSLPKIALPQIRFDAGRFLPRNWFGKRNISLKTPAFHWNWKKWNLTIPAWLKFSSKWKLPSISWNVNLKLKFPSLKNFQWKLPSVSLAAAKEWISYLRGVFTFRAIRWDVKSLATKIMQTLPHFTWKKRDSREKTAGKKRAFFSALKNGILLMMDSAVGKLPGFPQKALRSIGRFIASVFSGIFGTLDRLVRSVWKQVVKIFTVLSKVQENLQKMSAFSQKAKAKSKQLVDSGVVAISRPVIRGIETAHSKMIPVRLRLRRWTFLAAIVVELSLLFLSEAIIEFQEWNDTRWISKIRF